MNQDSYEFYLKWGDDLAQYYTASAQSIGESILNNLINGTHNKFDIAGFEDNEVLQKYLEINGTTAELKSGIGYDEFNEMLKALPGMTDDLYISLIKQYNDSLDAVKNAKKEIANGNITFDNLSTIYGQKDFSETFSKIEDEIGVSYHFTSQEAMKEFFKDSPELLKTYQLQLVSKLISISEGITDKSITSLEGQTKAILAEAGISIGDDVKLSAIPQLITDFISNIWAEAENTIENRIKAYEEANQVETKKARSSLLTSFGSIDVNDLMAINTSAIGWETDWATGIRTAELSDTYDDFFTYDNFGNLRVKSDVTFSEYWDAFKGDMSEYSTEWVESYTAWLAYCAENGMETSLLDLETIFGDDGVKNEADKKKIIEAYKNYFGSFDKGVEEYLTAIEELTASTTNDLSDVSVETRTLLWSLGIVKQAEDGSFKLVDSYTDLGSVAAQLLSELINIGEATSEQLTQTRTDIISYSYGIDDINKSKSFLSKGGVYTAEELSDFLGDNWSLFFDATTGMLTELGEDYLQFDENEGTFKTKKNSFGAFIV